MAQKAMSRAYAPYSKFRVGACILTSNGNVYTGCNIENASFGATICAERVAISQAILNGDYGIIKIAVCSDSDNFTFPCGICRQVIAEFSNITEIIVANKKGDYKTYSINDIMPYSFTSKDMEVST